MSACTYVEPRLRALIDGELSPREQARVQGHLEGCASCRAAEARIQSTVSFLHDQEPDPMPAHFTTELQLRLARHRRERAEARPPRRRTWLPRFGGVPVRARWAGGFATAGVLATLCLFVLSQQMGAADIAKRAQASWGKIQNYGCTFVSEGVYQGQSRSFKQVQFYRRPGEFRLDTSKDYRLTTFVYTDRVIHYLPGGHWKGKGPLVIVRPRHEGQDALPFPFGVTWNNGGNVSLDQLVRQLGESSDARVLGTEVVQGHDCYRMAFGPSAQTPDQYELWIDKESYLPRQVSWYRDADNHILTTATDLQVNYDVLPPGTFDFRVPNGAVVVHGDIDPHVLALTTHRKAPESVGNSPVAVAQYETWARSRYVPFPVYTPQWLPDGFDVVRVRYKLGRWVDAHWAREDADGTVQMLNLVEQDGATETGGQLTDGQSVVLTGGEHPVIGKRIEREEPYHYVTLSWRRGGTRFTLFAAGLSRQDVVRIAQSMVETTMPPQLIALEREREQVQSGGEPSVLPTEPESSLASEPSMTSPSEPPPAPSTDEPPMMPEVADDDRMPVASGTSAPKGQ